jgi:hypothetical protein
MPETRTDESDDQVGRNYDAFVRKLPELLTTDRGKFALMHDAQIVEFFDTAGDAYRAGQRLYQDQNFSIQEVTDAPADLGFFSYALRNGSI